MIYLILSLVVAIIIICFLASSLSIIATVSREQKNSIKNLETSIVKWMDTAGTFKKLNEENANHLTKAYDEIISTAEVMDEVKEALSKERSRNKSVEVRTGLIMEKMAPFFEVFNHDPKNAQFLGNPIDYVIFNEEEIVFLEVKTGKAKTTKKQKDIKKLIEEGKVKFELVRFDYE